MPVYSWIRPERRAGQRSDPATERFTTIEEKIMNRVMQRVNKGRHHRLGTLTSSFTVRISGVLKQA